jgi:Tfp pilus assembly protein PilF
MTVTQPLIRNLQEKLQQALELHRIGQLAQGQAGYEEILAIHPGHADAINLLAAIAVQTRNPQRAIELFAKAIDLDPNNVEAYCNSAMALRQLNQLDAALAHLEKAIALKGDFAEAYLNRGLILAELKQWDAALASYRQVIAIQPDYVEAHLACGHVLKELDRLEAALASCDRAIAIVDDYEEAYVGRASLLQQLKEPEAARASYDRAIALKPDYATAYHGRAHSFLLLGDFENGWVDYEWRWKDINSSLVGEKRGFPQPLWLGEELIAGRTILLYSEQGLGDTLQFCRYAALVADLGARVILEVQKPLSNLLGALQGVSQLVTRGDPLPAFDYRCPLMSLPLALGTRLDSIPAPVRYLTCDAAKVAKWRTRLGEKTQPRVGLVWSGSRLHKNDRIRSVPLGELVRHLPSGLEYVSLQKEVRDADNRTLQRNPWIRQFSDDLHDFTDTAALCDCLDVVISVDTAVAHLSAALGRITWILLPHVPDWRWLLDREDSPWYPTAKLFRQDRFGDWSGVFDRLKAHLMQKTKVR